MNERYAREQLASFCRMLYDRNITVSAGGNMSVRINEGEVIITPSGRNKGLLDPDDMVKLSRSSRSTARSSPRGSRPSSTGSTSPCTG